MIDRPPKCSNVLTRADSISWLIGVELSSTVVVDNVSYCNVEPVLNKLCSPTSICADDRLQPFTMTIHAPLYLQTVCNDISDLWWKIDASLWVFNLYIWWQQTRRFHVSTVLFVWTVVLLSKDQKSETAMSRKLVVLKCNSSLEHLHNFLSVSLRQICSCDSNRSHLLQTSNLVSLLRKALLGAHLSSEGKCRCQGAIQTTD